MNWNLIRISLASLLIAVFSSGCFESQWEEEVASNPSVAKISTTVLGKTFEADESSAKRQYKGQIIEVYGPVQEIHDEGDKVLVILKGENGEEIFCPVSSKHSADLDNLEIGRTALIKGKCRGIVRGNVTLGGCIIDDPLRELKTKAKHGDASAQIALATALSKPNKAVCDTRWAFHLYCKAAESGHKEAQGTVMEALMGAWSPETNAPVVWGWLQEEAAGGNTEACYHLGMLYNISEEFGIDPVASVPWFKKASDGGHQEAMFTMAMIYYDGELLPINREKSARLLSLVDSKILPRASEVLGLMTLSGEGTPKDVEKGLSLLEDAARNGRAPAAALIGQIYQAGEIVPKDEHKAMEWFLKAGEMGDSRSMAKAGLMLNESRDEGKQIQGRRLISSALENDTQVAYSEVFSHVTDSVFSHLDSRNPPLEANNKLRLRRINGTLVQGTLQEVKDKGLVLAVKTNLVTVSFQDMDVAGRTRCDPDFRSLLARSIIAETAADLVAGYTASAKPPSAKDIEEYVKLMNSLATEGDPDAQAWLGSSLLNENKKPEGLKLLKKSTEGGSPEGQYALGQAYFTGDGLPVDKKEAFGLFKQAADQGHAEAMLKVGRMLIAGDGCDRDAAGGLDLVRQSADAWDSQAILFMGRYNYGDKRGLRDAAKAFAWFRLGSVIGQAAPQYWLGRMYYEGKGIPKDYNRAIQWLTESASQGYRPASDLLDSDAYQREEMAKAQRAYKAELERHSKELERIRTNPKYDRVSFSRTPSFFGGPKEKAAYKRFTDNYFKGRFGSNIAKCADDAWRHSGSGRSSGRKASGSNIVNLGKGSDGLYDGVGPTGRCYTSPDGRTWTANMGGRSRRAPTSYGNYGVGSGLPSNPFGGVSVTHGFGEFGRMINPNGINF